MKKKADFIKSEKKLIHEGITLFRTKIWIFAIALIAVMPVAGLAQTSPSPETAPNRLNSPAGLDYEQADAAVRELVKLTDVTQLRNVFTDQFIGRVEGAMSLLGGTLVIETIFGWPGVGRYAVSAILNRDYPVIQCFTLLMVVIFVLCNLLVDIVYALADPRIRRSTGDTA